MILMIGYQFIMKKVVVPNFKSKKHNIVKIINALSVKLVCLILSFIIITTNISDAVALSGGEYGVGRMRSCDNRGDFEGLDFNPSTGGKDIEFVLTNPVCLTVIATTYGIVISSIALMNGICGTGSAVPRVIPSPIQDAWDIGRATVEAASSADPACAGWVAGAVSSWTTAFIQLGVIYAIAESNFKNTKICGFGWTAPNPQEYNYSSGGISEQRNLEIEKRIRQYQNDPTSFETDPDKRKLLGLDGVDSADKIYREWYYGGVEVEDDLPQNIVTSFQDTGTDLLESNSYSNEYSDDFNSIFDDEICRDPLRPKMNNGLYPPQRYYLRGLEAGNFNCERYMRSNSNAADVSDSDLSRALGCCQKRSRQFVCVDYGDGTTSEKVFCPGGQLCTINGITFSTKFRDNDRLICVESYSLCPYNFTLSGGSEVCDRYQDGIKRSSGSWDIIDPEEVKRGDCVSNSEIRNADCTYNQKAGKCSNYCQYLTHCSYTSDIPFEYKSSIASPYFSTACLDFQGDSQNRTNYSGLRHFSLPIAQCMKETLENMFYNRAGHSMCARIDEYPDANGNCRNGQYSKTPGGYDYKIGNKVENQSFFERIQDRLRDFVKLMLIFTVMFFGAGILVGKVNLGDKKTTLIFIVKFCLVLYFSLGSAWQDIFFKGVYNASADFGMIVFKINAGEEEIKRDGCQFGNITLPDGSVESSGRHYPPEKDYLAIFDTLDCKLMRYLGFGPEVSAANIAKAVLAGFFIGPIGIYLSLCLMIFGFFILALTIRCLHIFLSAALGIIILVFVSPLIIPTVMFEKTSNIFKGWLKQLISFTLQPMILFAYVALFITVMDQTLIGSAVFTGQAPYKKISCSKNCYFTDTGLISLKSNGEQSDCTARNEKFIDPMNDSVACLINMDDFGSWPGLEWIGLTIPILENILSGDVKKKILTLLKGALVMMLLYGFMDEVSGIASQLIGGAALPNSKNDPIAMFSQVAGKPGFSLSDGFKVNGGYVNNIEKRLRGGAGNAMKYGKRKAEEQLNKMGDKGKSTQERDGGGEGASDQKSSSKSGDNSSGGSGADQTGSSSGSAGKS